MESSGPARVLVVAHKTAATPALLDAVRERAARGNAEFTLLVPNAAHGLHVVIDAEDQDSNEAEQVLELAIPLLEEAAGGPVEGMVGDPSPMNAIQDAINIHGFDEVIISTLPTTVSKWVRLDLPSKVVRPRPARHHGDGQVAPRPPRAPLAAEQVTQRGAATKRTPLRAPTFGPRRAGAGSAHSASGSPWGDRPASGRSRACARVRTWFGGASIGIGPPLSERQRCRPRDSGPLPAIRS